MQDAAPALDDDYRRMERLRELLAEMRTAQEEEQQQLEEAIEEVAPGTVARVRHAVLEPEGNHLSVMQRLRNKIPGWLGKAAEEVVVLTMIGAITALVKMYMNPDPTLPTLPTGPRAGGPFKFYASCEGKSVVDEVFANAKAANRMRERTRPPTN